MCICVTCVRNIFIIKLHLQKISCFFTTEAALENRICWEQKILSYKRSILGTVIKIFRVLQQFSSVFFFFESVSVNIIPFWLRLWSRPSISHLLLLLCYLWSRFPSSFYVFSLPAPSVCLSLSVSVCLFLSLSLSLSIYIYRHILLVTVYNLTDVLITSGLTRHSAICGLIDFSRLLLQLFSVVMVVLVNQLHQ